MDTVEMYHPELQTHIQVPASAVPIHRNSGWITGQDENPKYEAPPEPAAEEVTTTAKAGEDAAAADEPKTSRRAGTKE